MGRLLNKYNESINRHTVELLEPQSGDRILDIGFGGGIALQMLSSVATKYQLIGVEYSEAMLARAQTKFRELIADGRLNLHRATAESLPFDSESIDRAYSVNCIYFWPDPLAGIREIFRVLKPGGRLLLAVHSPQSMRSPVTDHGFRLFEAEELLHLVREAGFTSTSYEHRDKEMPEDSVLIIADKKHRLSNLSGDV